MKTKTLYWASGILGFILLVILVILRISDKIKLGGLILFSIIVVVVVIGVDLVFSFRKPKSKLTEDKTPKVVINLERARLLASQMLANEQYSEYEKNKHWEDVLRMGKSNTPTYFKLVSGEFEGNLYGIVINMVDPDSGGIEEYDPQEYTIEDIKKLMMTRGNLAAMKAVPSTQTKTVETFDPLSGRSSLYTEPIVKEEKEEKNLEGELK